MLKLLIVDDMPIIADGLYELFCEEQRMPMEVYKAYSVPGAFSVMRDHQIDIIVTDIKMPEISGLELLKEVKQRQPQCKVIFLTSYHDFNFAREAIILGGSDFIMKTEGDARILEAVYKAAGEVLEERNSRVLIAKAQTQFRVALPSLQREFLLELLQGKPIGSNDRCEQFRALEIDLHPATPVYLVVARIDRWKQSMTWSDRALLLYSVRNIMNEYLSPKVRMVTLNLDSSHIVGIWQPMDELDDRKETSKSFRFFYGTLETIQNTCRELLKLRLSVVLGGSATSWEHIGEKLHRLEFLMQSGIGLNQELLTTDEELINHHTKQRTLAMSPVESSVYLKLARYSALPGLLASGKSSEFIELFEDLVVTVREAGDHIGLRLETLHYLSHLFIGFMNRRQLLSDRTEKISLDLLLRMNPDLEWERYADYYRNLALSLFEHASIDQKDHSDRLVEDVDQYILDNLNQDLSLTRLGEHVHLNPTYLSRLYKQITGKGISDYITEARLEKAKHLISHSDMKIHEIAIEVGYQSGIAFSRFFKKLMNIAPQDYRDLQQGR
ncbi:response regulator [Cohnella herbarum]|uniref:Response regulator n=1 Tax=Cohnella herbarum TaxID=2728023 RepID=A0A7Z2VPV0_9BACL|nr:response regulator [Cohnella herbarum]QJD86890.1 response regulator [Cohnella herbarum]